MDEPLLMSFRSGLKNAALFEVVDVGDWTRKYENFDALIMAALVQIQDNAPSGPLLFAGYSQGGKLAYATALAAIAAKRDVSGIILFDTAMTYGRLSTMVALRSLVHRCLEFLRAQGLRAQGAFSSSDHRAWVAWHVEWRRRMIAFDSLWNAWSEARRIPLDVPAVLLRSTDPGLRDLGWGETLPQLKLVSVLGGHRTMFARGNVSKLHEAVLKEIGRLTGVQCDSPGSEASVD